MIHGNVDFYSPPSVSVLPLVYQQANVFCVVRDTYFVLHTEINVWIIVLAAKKKHNTLDHLDDRQAVRQSCRKVTVETPRSHLMNQRPLI